MNNDLISRSALLEELKEQHDYIMQDPEVGKNMKWCESVCFHRTVETVESAPAVDAEKVFEQMGLVKEAFEMAKADLVPVVRCKDCYYWMKAKVNKKGFLICPASGMEITANDYCSYAEKRECHYDRRSDFPECAAGKAVCMVEYDESGCGFDLKAVPIEDVLKAPAVDAVEVVRCKD